METARTCAPAASRARADLDNLRRFSRRTDGAFPISPVISARARASSKSLASYRSRAE